jgi:protein-disulfide isomerase
MEEENITGITPNAQPASGAQNFAIPFAIVIAGLAIAGAIYFGDGKKSNAPVGNGQALQNTSVDPVTPDDHIIGNPNAKVVIVEYSDLECPFCKSFHPTMQQIMNEYGKTGQVAWVYRQFPIAGLHPKAHKESEASECATKLGGNTKFWEYINKIFEITPSNNGLDPAKLPEVAQTIGLDMKAWNACLDKGDMAKVVDDSIASGIKAGVNATPWSFILVNGKVVDTIEGGQPYATVKAQIDALLK